MTWNYGAILSPGTGAKVHLLCPQGCVLLGGLHTPTCLQVWCPVATSFPILSASLFLPLVHLVHSLIHSFIHSFNPWAPAKGQALSSAQEQSPPPSLSWCLELGHSSCPHSSCGGIFLFWLGNLMSESFYLTHSLLVWNSLSPHISISPFPHV